MTAVGEGVDRHQDVGFGEVRRGAPPRDVVGDDDEPGGHAPLAAEFTDQVDDLVVDQTTAEDEKGVSGKRSLRARVLHPRRERMRSQLRTAADRRHDLADTAS